MNEGQAFVDLPHFLKGNAERQYRASANSHGTGEVTCWPEAVQHLLRTYATPSAIRRATKDFDGISQVWEEDEAIYASRLNEAAYRCGNVHSESEKMTRSVNGLVGCLRTSVARYRKNEPRHELTMDRLVQYARDEGDTYRSRNAALAKHVGKPTNAVPAMTPLRPALRQTATSPPQRERLVSFMEEGVNDSGAIDDSAVGDGLLLIGDTDSNL